jgi:uncharacterized circularly permuted ATP-grasp superfamily protein
MGGGASPAAWDEAYAAPGVPREPYAELLDVLEHADLRTLCESVAGHLARRGVTFGGETEARPFALCPLPRLLEAAEWDRLAAGLEQRVRALNAFVTDAYGPRRIVAAGLLTDEEIEAAEGYEPDLMGSFPAGPAPVAVAGLDVVRDPEGELLVLEDNLRTPSGYAYAAAAREALEATLPGVPRAPRAFAEEMLPALGAALRAAAPDPEDASIVVLTDGPASSAYYEHAQIARRLGVPLVTLASLELRGRELHLRDAGGMGRRVDVVLRRCDEDRLRDDRGALTPAAELLLEPWRTGQVAVLNAFGTGVGDDKVIHAHVEEMIGLYLGEEPLVRSVETFALGRDPHAVAAVLAAPEDFVVKPRGGQGGHGVVVGTQASAEDLAALAGALRADPRGWVAQRIVPLSQMPTVVDGGWAVRHVDLRPFVVSSPTATLAAPGGLTRVAGQPGSLVVNSSQDGGGKDTWVLP